MKTTSQKNKRLGIFLIALPFIGLMTTLISWSIMNFVVSALPATNMHPIATMHMINILLSFIGLLSVIGFFILIPIGIIILSKKDTISTTPHDARSGKGPASEIPEEIRGWNWGAAGLTWIWGIYHGVWISLLCFIPFIGFIMAIILGFKGNEWAWRQSQWESVATFKKAQDAWMIPGIIFFMLGILFSLARIAN